MIFTAAYIVLCFAISFTIVLITDLVEKHKPSDIVHCVVTISWTVFYILNHFVNHPY